MDKLSTAKFICPLCSRRCRGLHACPPLNNLEQWVMRGTNQNNGANDQNNPTVAPTPTQDQSMSARRRRGNSAGNGNQNTNNSGLRRGAKPNTNLESNTVQP